MAPETKPELRRLQREAVEALRRCQLTTAAIILDRAYTMAELRTSAERCDDMLCGAYDRERLTPHLPLSEAAFAVYDLRMEVVRERSAEFDERRSA